MHPGKIHSRDSYSRHLNLVWTHREILYISAPACDRCMLEPASQYRVPFPSIYQAPAHIPTLIANATVLASDGQRLEIASVYFANSKIVDESSSTLEVGANTQVIDTQGQWVAPGMIDVHSQFGVYSSPDIGAHSDGNEATALITAEVWAEQPICARGSHCWPFLNQSLS